VNTTLYGSLTGTSATFSGNGAILNLESTTSPSLNGYSLAVRNVVDGDFSIINNTSTYTNLYINAGGFFKTSNDGTYLSSTGTYHELRSNISGNHAVVITSSSTNPMGLYVEHSVSTNNATNELISTYDAGLARFKVYTNGGIANYSANNVNLSDERAKKDIVSMDSQWNIFKNIDFVKYKYKDQTHDDYNYGVIAQQVLQVAPHLVDVDGWGETPEDGIPLMAVYDGDIHYSAHKALQEALIRIEELENEVQILKNK
jgi:hypothetical protein